jgi:hypothetical protein
MSTDLLDLMHADVASDQPPDRHALDWAALDRLAAHAPVAAGYRLALIDRADVGAVIAFIARWYPDISVGSASGYLQLAFYEQRVWFKDGPQRDVVVAALKLGDELVGVYSFECDREALCVHARMGVAAPAHRGAQLALGGIAFTETAARRMGMGIVYGMATLKAPYSQRAFERAGWQLIGIAPGLDREMVAPGVVKRVFEAVYAKALVGEGGLLNPNQHNMTQRTREVFRLLFCSAA